SYVASRFAGIVGIALTGFAATGCSSAEVSSSTEFGQVSEAVTVGNYKIKVNRTSNYLKLSGITVAPGAAVDAAEVCAVEASGNGVKFKWTSSGNYLRLGGTSGNDLTADTTQTGAEVFTEQNCNMTGQTNRFGYKSASGTGPYLKANSTTLALNSKN